MEQNINGFNEKEINEHWSRTVGGTLMDDETVRVVVMPSEQSSIKSATGSFTLKKQIRNPTQLLNEMIKIQGTNPVGSIGFALSTATYKHIYDVAPSIASIKDTEMMIIDVDARHKGKKDRFNVSNCETSFIGVAGVQTINFINKLLYENGLPNITPCFVNLTGGGFQIGVKLEKRINRQDGEKIFETFGVVLGRDRFTNSEEDQKEKKKLEKITGEYSVAMFEDSSEIFETNDKGITVPMKDMFGNYTDVFFEIDNSFKDISHAQRVIGTINQKYDAHAVNVDNLFELNNLKYCFEEVVKDFGENHGKLKIGEIKKQMYAGYTQFEALIKDLKGKNKYTRQPVDYILSRADIIVASHSNEVKKVSTTQLSTLEQKVLGSIKPYIELILGELKIPIKGRTARYLACSSPFREDTKPSFAVYLNSESNYVNIIDFADHSKYNILDVWERINSVSRTVAIEEIAEICHVELKTTEKKEFVNLQTTEDVMGRIAQIDVKDKIYYRLANKSKDCIMRNITTGEYKVFDGPQMIADHVLKNQLNARCPDMELIKEFRIKFQENILIDAFEVFEPGQDVTFTKDGIRYVNTWVRSKNFMECSKLAEDLPELDLEDAIELIKEELPAMYLYLLQLTQRGSLEYFVHWLAMVSKLRITVPTIPILTSVEGTGKNLFGSEVLEFYLNKEYVHTVDNHAMGSNFNEFMGSANLIIADEGDYNNSKDVDKLKGLTGQNLVRVEKKGQDAVRVQKRFNLIMFTNGGKPVMHTITDRRFTYFRLDISLKRMLAVKGWVHDEFIDKIRDERAQFWAIMMKTKLVNTYLLSNIQNGQYHRQILGMHPFGELILTMVEDDWNSVAIQLNEKATGEEEIALNQELLQSIKNAFRNGGGISFTLINKYLNAMPWKSTKPINKFIQENNLEDFGITTEVTNTEVKIRINKDDVIEKIKQENNLGLLFEEFKIENYKKNLTQTGNKESTTTVSSVHQNTAGMTINSNSQPNPVSNLPQELQQQYGSINNPSNNPLNNPNQPIDNPILNSSNQNLMGGMPMAGNGLEIEKISENPILKNSSPHTTI